MFDAKALLNAVLGAPAAANVSAKAGTVAQQGEQALGQVGAAVAGALSQAQSRLQGSQAGDLLGKATQVVSENQAAAGAAVAGLAGLLLGTGTGRSVLGDAVKVGGLAALGGLAYNAFNNYQAGRPLTSGVPGLDTPPPAAPPGSGFHADDHSHDNALLLVRVAVATAAADGVVDASQRARLLADMQGAGMETEAAQFLDAEIAHPATLADIAATTSGSPQLALQAYITGRVIASPASAPEQSFLASLAQALRLDPALVAQVNKAMPGA